jgi:hypothetical protein
MIIVSVSRNGAPVAEAMYKPGMMVEVRVEANFTEEKISFFLRHSQNDSLHGFWEEALDRYFNEGLFDSKESSFPGEMRRIGAAREHKSLFRQAAHALHKDLEPHGYKIDVSFL